LPNNDDGFDKEKEMEMEMERQFTRQQELGREEG